MPGAARDRGAMDGGDRDEPRFSEGEQHARDHLRSRMRLGALGGRLQIQAGAKRFAGSAQNQDALLWIGGGFFDRLGQFAHQFNRQRVAALRAIERDESDLRCLFFDEND